MKLTEITIRDIEDEGIYWMTSPDGNTTIGKVHRPDPDLPLEVLFFGTSKSGWLDRFLGWEFDKVLPPLEDGFMEITDKFSVKIENKLPVKLYRNGKPWMPINEGRLIRHLITRTLP